MAHMFPFDWNVLKSTHCIHVYITHGNQTNFPVHLTSTFGAFPMYPPFNKHLRLRGGYRGSVLWSFEGLPFSNFFWTLCWWGWQKLRLLSRFSKLSAVWPKSARQKKTQTTCGTADLYPRKTKTTMENLSFEDVSPTYRWWFSIDLLGFGGGGNVYNSEMMSRSD